MDLLILGLSSFTKKMLEYIMRTRYCSFCQAVFSLIRAKYINYSPFGGPYWEKTVIEVSDTQDLGHSFSQYEPT